MQEIARIAMPPGQAATGLWSRGFRPFFLAAGIWAALAMAVWPPLFAGHIALPTAFSPVDWHVHELVFGYGAAVVAGFLLTAVPNWTGRRPVSGSPLAMLAALWAAGRVAVLASATLGPAGAAIVDAGFLLALAAVIAREVLASGDTRNLKVVVLVLVLALANLGFHGEAAFAGRAAICSRLGIGVLVFLILLIGGRVVPAFTRNWLARQRGVVPPVAFNRADAAVMVLSGLSLGSWTAIPEEPGTGALLLLAGMGNAWRMTRWRGMATRTDPLVLVLHLGFLLAAMGFIATGLHAVLPDAISAAAGLHVWAVGAIGTMTLAMMTRATLGHSGKALQASTGTQLVYVALIVATAARVIMEFWPTAFEVLLYSAAAAWVLAFSGFVAAYYSMLTGRAE